MASLGAVVAYFWNDIKALVGEAIRALPDGNFQAQSFKITSGLVIGTIPLVIFGLLFKKLLDTPGSPFRTLTVIGLASIVMSLLLALAEKQGGRDRIFWTTTLLPKPRYWDICLVSLVNGCIFIS